MNNIQEKIIIPSKWKEGKMALIMKRGKSGETPSKYRPLSPIDSLVKVLEAPIRNRLTKEIDDKQLLSHRQFGFRKGRSTMQAIGNVINLVQKHKYVASTKWVVFNTLDIKNAFNSANWHKINEALEKKSVKCQTRKMVRSYLSDRFMKYKKEKKMITAEVRQGSVLGPTI